MIAVIKGDIIHSRKLSNPEKWIEPLKNLLSKWGTTPQQWELVWGDFFQVELDDPLKSLAFALEVKALMKNIHPKQSSKTLSSIGARMAIGIGTKTYTGTRISENNGTAFVHSGLQFDRLKKEKRTLAIHTPWPDFDEEINLSLKLATIFMDNWSLSSAELVLCVLQNPNFTQEEIGERLGIKQNSVSGRWTRSHIDELLEMDRLFRKKLKNQIG